MKRQLRVSVRELVDHSLHRGDLVQTLAESIHPTEAIRIHQKIQNSRPEGYRSEVSVSHTFETSEFRLEIRGRIDGVLENSGRPLIEEIKTVQRNPPSMNEIHWGQAMIYSYIYALQQDYEEIDLQLTYYLIKTGQILEFHRQRTLEELEEFFGALATRFLAWQSKLARWVQDRNKSIRNGKFPYDRYRTGQREMAVAVFRSIQENHQLLIQAPTGIGKTMAVLFPSIKAIAEGYTQRLFYLTARTTGKLAAEKALRELARCGFRLKTVTITAKQKICPNPEKECNPEECSYARGFYDRLDGALVELFRNDLLDRESIEQIARDHRICPFELSLKLARWVDCIICDYNHVFDPQANIRQVFRETSKKQTFLVDEAHNLPDRARGMFSSDLEKKPFLALKKAVRQIPRLSQSMGAINWHFAQIRRQICNQSKASSETNPPKALYPKLRSFLRVAEEVLLEDKEQEIENRDALLDLYFQVGSFLKVAERYDTNYVTCYEVDSDNLRIKLFCLDPSQQLSDVLKEGQASLFFSATLTPLDYFKLLLGCGAQTNMYRLACPFPSENFCLTIADRTSTLFRDRDRTKREVASLLDAFVRQRSGNYLIFFPSYQYMNLVFDILYSRNRPYETVVQSPEMTEKERRRFVARFAEDQSDELVGFAVMGGVFGEGIDLVGEHLTGAAVVGVGLPALSLERDLIRKHFDQKGLSGFDYAYRFPGINRVLQAAGRVIRSEFDRGSVLLIDDRYSRFSYRSLLLSDWNPAYVRTTGELSDQLHQFWAQVRDKVVSETFPS